MAKTTITQFPAGQAMYRVEFDYLARPFVIVTLVNSLDPAINRVLTVGNDYRFISPTMIEILTPQVGYDVIRIQRQTDTELVVGFRDGSVLTAKDLTNAELQAIHISEEGRDQTVDLAKEYADSALNSANSAEAAKIRTEQVMRLGLYGYVLLEDFQKGNTLSIPNHALKWSRPDGTGEYYRWDGPLDTPKVVPPGSTPASTGGVGAGAWLSVGDGSLRTDLIKPNVTETVRVPSQYATLQQAISYLLSGRINVIGYSAEIIIDSGHSPASGISLTQEDASCITLKSDDAVVTLSPLYPVTKNFIEVTAGGKAPKLGCLVDANARCNNGYLVDNASWGYVLAGCGVINTLGSGLVVRYASTCYANSTKFTGAAKGGGQTSGILAWAASISAELADVSGSAHYGAQSAHGGYLSFRQGNASNCGRYGLRATDSGFIDADTAKANDCGLNGVRAFNLGIINFRDGQARNCGNNTNNSSGAISAAYASNINCVGADLSGAKYFAILAINSQVTASQANLEGAYRYGILAQNASNVAAGGVDVSFSSGYGIRAEGSSVHCPQLKANNCASYGISADGASTVNAENAQVQGCGTGGIAALNGSTVNANGSDTTGAVAGNCLFSWGGRISALDAQAQAGPSPAARDIRVLAGGTISCNSATVGGLSQAANTIAAAGIIFK